MKDLCEELGIDHVGQDHYWEYPDSSTGDVDFGPERVIFDKEDVLLMEDRTWGLIRRITQH